MLMCGRREGADGIRVCSRRVHEGQLNFGFGNGDESRSLTQVTVSDVESLSLCRLPRHYSWLDARVEESSGSDYCNQHRSGLHGAGLYIWGQSESLLTDSGVPVGRFFFHFSEFGTCNRSVLAFMQPKSLGRRRTKLHFIKR